MSDENQQDVAEQSAEVEQSAAEVAADVAEAAVDAAPASTEPAAAAVEQPGHPALGALRRIEEIAVYWGGEVAIEVRHLLAEVRDLL